MSRRERYVSSYDPRYTGDGKIQVPPTTEQQRLEYERRQHQFCGCGDPRCTICNPEIAAMAATSAGYERFVRDIMGPSRVFTVDIDFSGAASPPKAGPPNSYATAREAVKKWIVPAPDQAFDDIVGNDEGLSQLREAIEAPIKHAKLYAAYGMKMPKGALLSGPPGCGKTMFAKAAASEMKRLYGKATELISISGGSLQTMFVGQTEGYIRDIFAYAREYAAYHKHPLLVFLDEAEVLLPDRTGRVRRVAPWEESQVATFLAEMDGMQESGAFVLLASNRPEVIDQAVLRDGRCDFKITVKRPNREAIETILQKSFAGAPVCADSQEQLVMAALESFFDPHKVILEAHALGIDLAKLKVTNLHEKHFLLEHIVSGAMAVAVRSRATRYAFSRDKESGVAKGITVADVIQAVNALFEENKSLDHAFALEEFRKEFMKEAEAKRA